MNIIIRKGPKNGPGFSTYSGSTRRNVREAVKEAAEKYGQVNRRMMEHEMRRVILDNDPKKAAELLDEGTREISRIMDPDNDPVIVKPEKG